MAKSKTARDTKLHRAAREISTAIANLCAPVTDEQVFNVMQSYKCSKRVLCDAFWLMDNEPAWFANYQTWHPRLRSLRNHPIWGDRLFALFS